MKVPVPPKIIILTPLSKLLSRYKKLIRNKWITGIIGQHLCINPDRGVYISTGWGIGSPGMISVCEELRALGATTFYLVGIGGRLSEDINLGESRFIHRAFSGEGTSGYYSLSKEFRVESEALEARFGKAGIVSTDAPFRETSEFVVKWKEKGAGLVDMETSALYAFCNFYDLKGHSIITGSDLLTETEWKMTENPQPIEKKTGEIIDYVVKSL